MPVDATILADNPAQRRRLEAIASRLGETELQRDLDGGWTVAVALAHLAFWDRLYLQHLRRWQEEGLPSDDPGDSLNDVLLDEWLAMTPRRTIELALAAARAMGYCG